MHILAFALKSLLREIGDRGEGKIKIPPGAYSR
jgi:hypothetical protein